MDEAHRGIPVRFFLAIGCIGHRAVCGFWIRGCSGFAFLGCVDQAHECRLRVLVI